MNGRTERELIEEQKIMDKLEKLDDKLLTEFYYWMHEKSVTTKRNYIYYVTSFIQFCHSKGIDGIENAGPDIIGAYIRECGIKRSGDSIIGKNDNSIVAVKFSTLKTFFRFLVIRGYIEKNPCDFIERPKLQEKDCIVSLTKDEIKEFMDNIETGVGSERSRKAQDRWRTRDRALCILPLVFGFRITAIHDINVEDVDFKNKKISVIEKENKYRVFPVPDEILEILKDWVCDRRKLLKGEADKPEALFLGYYNGKYQRLTTKAIGNIIKKYTSTLSKKITAHKLRDTYAMNVYEATGDIYLVSNMLGHSSPETTRRYVKVSEDKKRSAAEIAMRMVGV